MSDYEDDGKSPSEGKAPLWKNPAVWGFGGIVVFIASVTGYAVFMLGDNDAARAREAFVNQDVARGQTGRRFQYDAAMASVEGGPPVDTGQAQTGPSALPERRVQPMGYGFVATRPAKPQPPANSPAAMLANAQPETIAGLPVRRGVMVSGTENMLTPGMEIQCNNVQPLGNFAGARFRANIPEAVRGGDGRELLPAGSYAIGSVTQKVERGDTRLTSTITHIFGPKPAYAGIPQLAIEIGEAQMGDQMGQAGMPTNIQNDFGRRFATVGAYALLDLTSRMGASALQYGINNAMGGTDINVNLGQYGNGGMARSLAGRAYESEMNKPVQAYRPQAHPCSIFIDSYIRVPRQ